MTHKPIRVVDLLPLDEAALAEILADAAAFLKRHGDAGALKDVIRRLAEHTQKFQQAHAAAAPWIGYLAQDPDTGEIVGTCSYKGNPTPEGVVEIAYLTFPPFEKRGYGTAMAQELLAEAFVHAEVAAVIAHTKPKASPSTRLLETVGLRKIGDVQHPDDGRVWLWELRR